MFCPKCGKEIAKILTSFIILTSLPVVAVTLQGSTSQNISTIKCKIVDNSEVSIKVKGYPYPPHKEQKQDNYDLILTIDDTNKKVMDMYQNDEEFKMPNISSNSISFHKVFEYKNYKSDIIYNINRLTGKVYGLGQSTSNDSFGSMFTTHSISGTCEPYKIEKKF